MKVKFRSSGGVTGRLMGCELDTDSLPKEEARTLKELVEQSGILEAVSGRSEKARDLRGYEITIEDEGRERRVSLDDLTVPESVWSLIELLQSRSRPLDPR